MILTLTLLMNFVGRSEGQTLQKGGINMTKLQFKKKAQIALRYGIARLDDGYILYYWGGPGSIRWSLENDEGNTIKTAVHSYELEFLFD